MPSRKIIASKKSARPEVEYRRPRPISPIGGGFQGGVLSGPGTGTDR